MAQGLRKLLSATWAARPRQLVLYGAAFLGMTVLTAVGTWAGIDRWGRTLADSPMPTTGKLAIASALAATGAALLSVGFLLVRIL